MLYGFCPSWGICNDRDWTPLFFGRRGTCRNVDLHVWSTVWSFDEWMSSGLCPFSWDYWCAKYAKTVSLSEDSCPPWKIPNVLDYRRNLKQHACTGHDALCRHILITVLLFWASHLPRKNRRGFWEHGFNEMPEISTREQQSLWNA